MMIVSGEIAGRVKPPPPPGPIDVIVYVLLALTICAAVCTGGFAVGYWVSRILAG
jgi:hypothetical protein